MTRSLRRSRRSPKRLSEYNVGDIVEVHRNGATLQGRLAQLLTEGTSPNPRWLVKFENSSHKDEEMYERAFRKVRSSSEDDEESVDSNSSTTSPKGSSPQRKTNTTKSTANSASKRKSVGKPNGTSSEGEGMGQDTILSMTNDDDGDDDDNTNEESGLKGSNAGSDVEPVLSSRSKGSIKDRVSAREERSRRRQTKIDEETIIPGVDVNFLLGGKRRAHHSSRDDSRNDAGGEVIKVKLLTGTLLLHRGKRRRVEFIRRV